MRIYTHSAGSHYVNRIHEMKDLGTQATGRHYQLVSGPLQFDLVFQSKNPSDGGDGVINEQLLALLIDRLTLQNDLMPCEENLYALQNLKEARTLLECREQQRSHKTVEVERGAL